MRAGTWLAVALVLLASCQGKGEGSGAGGPGPLRREELAALSGMAKSLDAMARMDGSERRVQVLAEAFGEVTGQACYRKLAAADPKDRMRIFVVDCDALCPRAKEELPRLEAGSKWAKAVEVCGPARYGLRPGQEHLGSLDLAIVAEVAAWYVPLRKRLPDDHELAPVLDAAAAKVWLPLPLPSTGPVTLARSRATMVQASPYYAVISADRVTGGRAPQVRLSKAGVEWRHPDQLFPGTAGPLADLVTLSQRHASARRAGVDPDADDEPTAKVPVKPTEDPPAAPAEPAPSAEPDGGAMALDEGQMGKKAEDRPEGQYQMKKRPDQGTEARRRHEEEARKAGILGTIGPQPGGAFASITGTGDFSSGLDASEIEGGLYGDALQLDVYEPEAAPLILADAGLPAARVVAALGEVPGGWVHLGVDEGGVAAAHALPIGIVRGEGGVGDALGTPEVEIRLELDDEGFTLVAATGETAPGKSGDDIVAAYAELRKVPALAGSATVVLSARGDKRTMGELVAVLDGLKAGGARRLVVRGKGGGGLGASGGTGWGTIGTGRYGTLGQGSGLRGRRATVPSLTFGQPTVVGDLDKNIIRRYLKRAAAKLSYCYEKQLLVNPRLEGTVTAAFVITPTGQVAKASASGLDSVVAECVAGVVRSIQFPKPTGGGVVQVSYPFAFRTGGE